MLMDLPPHLHERVVCSISAAVKFNVPVNVILAVAEQEGGKPGQWVKNANGTHDVGAMQFNTAYLKTELNRYGITPADVAASGCYSYELASWRIKRPIDNDNGDLWTKVANYHSRTPLYNTEYRNKLVVRAARWKTWLASRFVIEEMQSVRNASSFQTPKVYEVQSRTKEERKASINSVSYQKINERFVYTPREITSISK
jgi:hypothetical protein